MRKSENIRELEYLASSQWGMFTTAQAGGLGVGRTQISRMVASETVEQVRRGIYRYTVGEETSHVFAKAAWLACYPRLTAAERLGKRPHDAVLACNTAAALHGIGDFHEDPYTFIVHARRQTTASDLSFHLWELDELDVTYVDALPVTTMERTVVDLVRERHDPDHVMRTARAALFRGVDHGRFRTLMNGLGPSYNKEIMSLTAGGILTEECEVVVRQIVSDVMASLKRGEHVVVPDPHEVTPMEREFAAIVRKHLRPVMEVRAAEIEEQRLAGGPSRTGDSRRVRVGGEVFDPDKQELRGGGT